MPLAAPIQNNKVKGQPAARRYQRYRDQHGRKWGANIEIKTGDFCAGVPERLGWRAPLELPSQYIRIAKDPEDGSVVPGLLFIDYEAWLQDARRALQDHQERADFFASAMFGEQAGAMLAKMPPELRRLLKSGPAPIEPIFAAMRGDPWVLGLVQGPCPEYLATYFERKAPTRGAVSMEELEEELDPAFVERMERAFDEHRKKKGEAKDQLAASGHTAAAERARADQELEDRRTAAAVERTGDVTAGRPKAAAPPKPGA